MRKGPQILSHFLQASVLEKQILSSLRAATISASHLWKLGGRVDFQSIKITLLATTIPNIRDHCWEWVNANVWSEHPNKANSRSGLISSPKTFEYHRKIFFQNSETKKYEHAFHVSTCIYHIMEKLKGKCYRV